MRQILERHGQTVTWESGDGGRTIRAFLQPQTEKGELDLETRTSLGAVDGRLWLYLGQAPVKSGDILSWENWNFRVRSSRPCCVGERLIYWWASLERAKEAAE